MMGVVAVDRPCCLVIEDTDLMHLRCDAGELVVVVPCRFILGDDLKAFIQ